MIQFCVKMDLWLSGEEKRKLKKTILQVLADIFSVMIITSGSFITLEM